MKDNPKMKKHKRARSSSNSSVLTISDDDSPKPSTHRDKKSYRERHKKHHKHHHKYNRRRSSDSASIDDTKIRDHTEKNYKIKHKDYEYSAVRIKEELLSDNEREENHRRHTNNHPRYSRNDNSRVRPSVKEEPKNETEPEWGKKDIKKEKKEPAKNNAKPDFGLSGKLAEDTNTFNGIVIKYSEPPEARKPKRRWRLYPFKGDVLMSILHIHRQSAYLVGRDRKVVDIPIDHPSCSKQHAALQYRLVPFTRADGSKGRQIRPYVMDLESANGTFLNNEKIDPKRYFELKEKDIIKFGFSTREYVVLHDNSKDSDNDDDDDVRNGE